VFLAETQQEVEALFLFSDFALCLSRDLPGPATGVGIWRRAIHIVTLLGRTNDRSVGLKIVVLEASRRPSFERGPSSFALAQNDTAHAVFSAAPEETWAMPTIETGICLQGISTDCASSAVARPTIEGHDALCGTDAACPVIAAGQDNKSDGGRSKTDGL
jgi:hypothetical protein